MTYTAANIRDIKAAGKFDAYLAMERDLIAALDAAEIVETRVNAGHVRVSLAHLNGDYSYWEGQDAAGKPVYESFAGSDHGKTVAAGAWDKEWTGFASLNAAQQYARAALRNHLTAVAHNVRAAAAIRLAALEAAI